MKNQGTIHKRRNKAINIQADHKEAWKISLKYSEKLILNKDKYDLYDKCFVCYNQFMNELKNKKLNTENKKYTQIWDTLLNTINHKEDFMQRAIHILHLTNVKKINKISY